MYIKLKVIEQVWEIAKSNAYLLEAAYMIKDGANQMNASIIQLSIIIYSFFPYRKSTHFCYFLYLKEIETNSFKKNDGQYCYYQLSLN